MGICFATCEPHRALAFINQMYPNYKDLNKEDVPLLYDLINKDILRVQDPNFHQPCQIIGGNNYDNSCDAQVQEAVKEFQAALESNREAI